MLCGSTNSADRVKTLLPDTMIRRVSERNCRCEVLTTGCVRNAGGLLIDSPRDCEMDYLRNARGHLVDSL